MAAHVLRPFDATRSAQCYKRRVWRLARLVFPAIDIDRTRFIWTTESVFHLAISGKHMMWRDTHARCASPRVPQIDLTLAIWRYHGRRKSCQLTLAYELTQDVCVILAESVRVWKTRSRSEHVSFATH